MKKQISLHFTIKDQSIEKVKSLLNEFLKLPENADVTGINIENSHLNHCFLPEHIVKEKGFSNEIYDDILNNFDDKTCWFGQSGICIDEDRHLMLTKLKESNGTAIFVGDIKEGVHLENVLVKTMGINIIEL